MASSSASDAEITPPWIYFNRRRFMQGAALAGTVAITSGVYRWLDGAPMQIPEMPEIPGLVRPAGPSAISQGFRADDPMTALADIANYNNFYEFTTKKASVAAAARAFEVGDWKLSVDGMVHAPRTFGLGDLAAFGPPEERVYRMRCVEAWSMVVPWAGVPLARVLEAVEPMAGAKYVAFETLFDPTRFPGQRTDVLDWPYVEGLRLDEAMHPLTLLATGLYGRELPAQDGAPIRLIVPWKYGFKGIKSIVKISLVASRPPNTWNLRAPSEYGFFANVNPTVDHPRWSQATERRIGRSGRIPTRIFNGYEAQVAHLYAGMDLREDF